MTRIVSAASGMTKFGMSADGTGVELGCNGDLRDALGIAMEIGVMTRMQMTKMLMPKNAKLITSEVMHDICRVIIGSKEQLSK
jgi:hypothetical protein